jgi:mannose-6-phosphate isomerase
VDYPTPEPDFALSRIVLPAGTGPVTYRTDGPEVLLCTSGRVCVSENGTTETLGPGHAVWVPASTPVVELEGADGATVFRTRVGGPETGTA